MSSRRWISALAVGVACIAGADPVLACASDRVAKFAGDFPSPGGACVARLVVSPMGGWLQLSVGHDALKPTWAAVDVTAVVWIDEDTLVYSTSPVYGKPGVYIWNCQVPEASAIRIVEPTHFDAGSPDGTDYFELRSIVGRDVEYYYGANVDEIDFANFRVDANVRRITVD